MNFFERQRQARADSRRLLLLFGLAVLGVVIAVELIVLFLLDFQATPQEQRAGLLGVAANKAPVLIAAALVTIAIIGITSLVRAAQLRAGGGAIARGLGGTAIPSQSRDLRHQRLRNVVEEVAIASGVPVPEIYVLEHEAGINAFAAGFSTADAAVAVTRGALEQLDRDELQGVIAHEFSHVLNGDMRLNLRLIGWLAGITALAVAGRILMRARGRNAGGIVLLGLGLVLIGWIGLFCARMIKAGISRKREYLADASAVQFTRQTRGIAGALKKIAASGEGSRLTATDAEEASHLLFGDGVGYSRLFATHPPLEERIQALEPGFKLTDLTAWVRERTREAAAAAAEATRSPLPDLEFTRVLGEAAKPIPAPVVIAGLSDSGVTVRPDEVIGQVGNPASDDFATAELLHAHFPPELDAAAHAPERAPALLAGLLLAGEPEARGRQVFAIGQSLGADAGVRAAAYAHAAAALHPMQRLPLAEVAFAALRRLPAAEMQRLRELAGALIAADGRISLFEFCLGFLLRQQIDESLAPGRARATGRRALKDVEAEIGLLLSLLTREGQREQPLAERAFAAGVAELGPAIAPRYAVPADWPARLETALVGLDQLKPAAKSLLIAAMTRTVMHDNRLDVAESELLRTACAALHCPLPPLLHENGGATRRRLD